MYKLIFLLFLSISCLSHAESIKIKLGEQGAEQKSMPLPQRAQTKSVVLQNFGEPISKTAAKGQPPISSWTYAKFVVYFESDHVIHSVLKHKEPKLEQPDQK